MSTRSNIAIELPDGKVKAIYVHSDGYPNGVGHCLLNYYNAYKKEGIASVSVASSKYTRRNLTQEMAHILKQL